MSPKNKIIVLNIIIIETLIIINKNFNNTIFLYKITNKIKNNKNKKN